MALEAVTTEEPATSHRPGARYLPELDGIRGIAILMVIAFHFGLFDIDTHSFLYTVYRSTIELGWAGVDLFFVLSGCLITGILLDTKNSEHYFRTFYIRRVLRILPLYYLIVFAFFCICLPIGNALAPGWFDGQEWAHIPAREGVWYWFHLSNWRSALGVLQTSPITHFWSLSIEEQFYLVWPLVVLYCSDPRLLKVCIGLILLSVGLRNIPYFQAEVSLHSDFIYRLTPFRLDSLAFGAILAVLSRGRGFGDCYRRWSWLPLTIGASVLLSIVAALRDSGYRNEAMSRYGFTAVSVICFAIVGYGLLNSGSIAAPARILRIPLLVTFGKYSYGMYVLHLPLAFFWPGLVRTDLIGGSRITTAVASIVCGLAISYLMALLSWHLIEHRFLRLKDRFSYKASRPQSRRLAPHFRSTVTP
jgi:peptidoglycan/LPS O-acetylase OafA/YrhL